MLSAIILLGILIFVHEFGHFLFAKMLNVKVERFSLGFGPRLVGRKWGETEYIIAAFPLGGYVKMFGENPEEEPGEPAEEISEADLERAFNRQPVWKRVAIVSAGPVFNIFFAALVYVLVFMSGLNVLSPEVGEVLEDSPAEAAGLLKGDVIREIDGVEINEWSDISGVIYGKPGETVVLKVKRADEELEIEATPERKSVKNIFGEEKEIGLIGIKPSGASFERRFGPVQSVRNALSTTVNICWLTVVAVVKLIQRVLPADTLGGPIMIMQMASQQASEGMESFFMFMAAISINLGILNLFPIPVLDGGHLVFLGIEAVRKKPLNEKTILLAQKIGIVVIVTIMAFALYNDIVRVVTGRQLP